jgi:ribosomal protein S18 acetylase RimI-like enzyme
MDATSFLTTEDDEVVAAAVQSFASLVRHLHLCVERARVIPADDVLILDSSVADDTFNLIALTRFAPEAAARRVAETLEAVRATGRPFSWSVDPFASPQLPSVLEAAGLKEHGCLPLMCADLTTEVAPEPQPVLGELEIRRVTTEQEFADYARTIADLWQPPAPGIIDFFGQAAKGILGLDQDPQDPKTPFQVFIGYLDGEPVCTAQSALLHGVATFFNIVTAAGFRKRGFGAAMTLAVMRAARGEGYRTAVLQASPMGEPVYRRLGFTRRGQYLEFTVEP